MKTKLHYFLSLSVALFLAISTQAQNIYDWSEPSPITDSLTFNSNPSGWLIDDSQQGVFYEKRDCDTCKSDIWFRNLTTFSPEGRMISGEANYSNPLFYYSYSNLYKGFLLYLSDSLENIDVFASVVNNDLTLGETFQLTSTPGNESNLVASLRYDNNQIIGWIQDSSAWASTPDINESSISLTNLLLIDSLSVTNLKYNNNYAYIQRKAGDSLHLYYHQYEYDASTHDWYWQEAIPIDTTGNNTQLALHTGALWLGINCIVWVKGNHIYTYSQEGWWGPPLNTINTYELPSISHPSLVSWDLPVKSEFDAPRVLAYSTGTGDSCEIYGSFGWYSTYDTVNITHNNIPDTDPFLFWGEPTEPMSNWVYAVWQSHRNDYAPLYFSKAKAYIGSDIDEMNARSLTLNTSPNPFTKNLEITLSSTKNTEINLTIYSLSGKIIWHKMVQTPGHELQTCFWNPEKQIPKGLYLVVAEQNGVKLTQQVVYK